MVLDELSNTQLARVFNAVTGQTVAKFTNNTVGLRRVRKALEQHSIAPQDAIEMAGIKPRDDVRSEVAALPPDPVPATPTEKVEGVDYTITTDKYGYRHRQPIERPKPAPKPRKEPVAGKPAVSVKHQSRSGPALEQVLGMLRRKGGATCLEIADAMNWLPHTTRAYLSRGGAAGRAATIMTEKVERDGRKTTVYSAR